MLLFKRKSCMCHSTYLLPVQLVALVLFLLSSPWVLAQNETTTDDGVLLKELTTPQGIKFWYYPLPDADRTALVISWAQEVPSDGSVHPSVARVGLNLMLKGGAGGRDAADIGADFQDLDAESDMWAEARSVTGFIVAPDDQLASTREIAAQVLTEPALEQRWFDRELQEFIESVEEEQSQLWEIAWNLVGEVLVQDHPYRDFWSNQPVDDLKAVSLEDVQQWFKSSFSKKTSSVAVAGSVSADIMAEEIDLLFADLPETAPVKPVALNQLEVSGSTILLHTPDAPKSLLLLVGNLPVESEDVNLPLSLGLGVLGGSQKSRLFKSVRSELGASYGFGAGQIKLTPEHRLLQMSGEIETAQLQAALDIVEESYTDFRNNGVGRVEFPLTRRLFKREFVKQLNDPVRIAYEVNRAMQNGFNAEYLWNFEDHIDSLNRADTNSLISETFPDYADLLKIIISPDAEAVEGACVISKMEEVQKCF